MLDNLLFFLGVKSYDVNYCLVKKIDLFVKETAACPYENIKIIKSLSLVNDDIETNVRYRKEPKIMKRPSVKDKIYYIIYTIYFVLINLMVLIQPVYNLYNYTMYHDKRHLISFFIHSNLPIIHQWLKYYFKTNHLENILQCKNFKSLIIIASSIISIIVNFCHFSSIRNDYIWLNPIISSDSIFCLLIFLDWIYTRLIIFLFVYTFIFVLRQHNTDILDINKKIKCPEEEILDNSVSLSNIILNISLKKNEIIKTINLFNDIVTFITLIGGISISLFVRLITPDEAIHVTDIKMDNVFDIYIFYGIMLILINQLFMLWNIYLYTKNVENILSNVKSYEFVKRYLYRIQPSVIFKNKAQSEAISLMNLSISEDSATTLDWLILCDMLSDKWLEFTLFGISTSDGKLIKKGLTLVGSLWFSSIFILK